ncbi:heavy metal translocating P-type ATPase [Taibaiella chishuiensis]|uniref:P-type Zn(2+) transporter n=1 Tax=Taibaiella chishuiensis TaxID=1434707 RepID=A0A2P8CVX5_9BACT|nr:heavy metal translocating P-type ATPase [Taibaiella chishuiensis]PSK89117.1 Cd2+/Zn2+-exporting ATPase [Taibaiella chishuiensis]
MLNTDPNHKHTYDAQGRMTCCHLEDKIYAQADAAVLLGEKKEKQHDHGKDHDHEHDHDHDHDHDHSHGAGGSTFRLYLPALVSLALLLGGILLDNYVKPAFFSGWIRTAWYIVAYLPVGLPVIKEAFTAMARKEIFTEFTLMVMATLGAFAIGEYPEAVAVMLFYAIGELFQSAAVSRAKGNIKALLDVRPAAAEVERNGSFSTVAPEAVAVGERIRVKVGEKVPLDGLMLTDAGSFNTAALTGESKPQTIRKGAPVLAGMLNLDKVIELQVSRVFSDSSLARILEMVQNATARKAKTELLIRKFARVYTPVVFFLAVALVLIPYFLVPGYVFSEWLYRALIFLVISCPCALVISIPLGYFGGIGAASKNGILFKGSNYLELMTKVNTVVMDKTGTLTEGLFKVQEVIAPGSDPAVFIQTLAAVERQSTHPIAKAIAAYAGDTAQLTATGIEEIPGHGLKGAVNGATVLAGNTKLLDRYNISYPKAIGDIVESVVVVAIDGQYAGYVTIADEIKADSREAITSLHNNGVTATVMLSGDKDSITQKVAAQLGIDTAYGGLLPEHKVQRVEELKKDASRVVAFVGDGINDAPVLALSDIGIAMGAMGSDAAIETADVVIQTDQPSKIATAIKIGKATRRVVLQNIILAFAVKVAVLALGAGGLATMWEAVFADVGVALLAILNAVRIQKMRF